MSATPTADAAARARRRRIIRIAQVGFSVAIVVAIFAYAIPKFADYRSVWAVLQRLTWPQLGLLVAATLFNLLTYWLQLMAALPGLTLAQAAVNNQTTTSIANTVPAGKDGPAPGDRCRPSGDKATERILRHRRLVATWGTVAAQLFLAVADTEEVTSRSVAVEHARRWSWPRTVVDEAFVRTPNFAPDGPDRPAETPVRTAVGHHLLARRKSYGPRKTPPSHRPAVRNRSFLRQPPLPRRQGR